MFSMNRGKLILLLCGMNLMLLQFLMLREFSMILTGLELVVVLLGASFFLGFSVGYAVSDQLSERTVQVALVALFFLHLTLPFSPRWLAGYLALQGAKQHLLPILMFVAAFFMSAAYSVFLPRMIGRECSGETVGRFYSIELVGSMLGLAWVAVAMYAGQLFLLMLTYFIILGVLVAILLPRPLMVGVLVIFIGAYALSFSRLDQSSLEYFFKHTKHISSARSLYRVHSAYQKVDVLENKRGDRFLYLNGLLDFNSKELEAFNFFLSEVPARLQQKSKVLIVGSGSMSSVNHVSPYASSIQTVELDGAVATAGQKFFSNYNRLKEIKNWKLTIDDAKHFLGSHPDEKFDLVIMDVPSPKTIQEAILHSTEFYSLVAKHLTEEGIISVSLSANFRPDSVTATSVAASLMLAFPESFVVTSSSAGRSFALAGRHLRFSRNDIEAILKERPNEIFAVFDRRDMQSVASDAMPISFGCMNVVLNSNLRRVGQMYFPSNVKGM